MRRSAPLLALTALVTATLAACGSSGTSSTDAIKADTTKADTTKAADTRGGQTGGSVDSACDLLTVADVNAAAGGTFDEGKLESKQQTPFGTYTVCSWSEQGHPLTTVRVSTWEKATAYDEAKSSGDEETNTVGEKSYVGSLASVYAVVNGHTLFVQYYDTGKSDDENTPISTALAKKAAERL